MVHQTTYRGVHSGNTLRTSSCRFKRNYHSQGCIVSRVCPSLLRKLVDQSQKSGDRAARLSGIKSPENTAVDVALSLNKQSRWLLPSALVRQVQTNDILQSGLTVSVLERHKLKRPANCISFHSNQGEVKRIQPHKSLYFSFDFPNADGRSRRALRRERREEALGCLRKVKVTGVSGKAVDVVTEQGHSSQPHVEMGETEVRYEVFYPSRASSSISHNPKYIKQDIADAPGSSEQHTQQGKPRKQHRGKQRMRMTLKDIDDFEVLSDEGWVNEGLGALSLSTENFDQDDFPQNTANDVTAMEPKTTDYLFSSLIEKAERLQNFKGAQKDRRSKSNKYVSKLSTQKEDADTKSHIVYLPEATGTDQEYSEFGRIASKNSSARSHPSVPSEFTRVLLPSQDVTVASLEECFGRDYFEAACKPRKFVLDVSSEVREIMKKKGVQAKVADVTHYSLSYLIFIHDGFYNEEYDVYKVFLNSKLRSGLLAVEMHTDAHQDIFRGTLMTVISRAMDFVDNIISDLQERNHFPAFLSNAPLTSEELQRKHNLGTAEAYTPSVQRLFQLGSSVSDMALPTLWNMLLDDPAFCDVCYDDISPLKQDSAAATSLLKCGHRVCDRCWSHHIHSRLRQGYVRVACPGYDCQEEMDLGVMLSVTDLDSVEQLLQRQEEVRIGDSETEKWCPNQLCGRVLSLLPSSPHSGKSELECDVSCACGAFVCFRCLSSAHWPASCKQAEAYRTTMATANFPDPEVQVDDDNEGKQKPSQVTEKNATTASSGRRVSLMERAAEHRQQRQREFNKATHLLARSVSAAAAKDTTLARLIIKTCSPGEASESSHTPQTAGPNDPKASVQESVSVIKLVVAFLRNAARTKQELHEVVEYSLVLLKDLPDCLLRRRALRIADDMAAFCTFSQSIFDAWSTKSAPTHSVQEAVKAVVRMSDICKWMDSALSAHVTTVKKLRKASS